jgi:LacI family transcriptional regulator
MGAKGERTSITRDDVARRAGVSSALVSYVINNGPRPVAAATRARVLAAIRELGYNPSAVARSLRLQRSTTIGIIVPTLDLILAEVIRGAQQVVRQRGLRVVQYDVAHQVAAEHDAAEALIGERAEGVIWVPSTADLSPGRRLMQSHIPLVLIDPPEQADEFAAVGLDNERGGYLATRHLLELGHRRIALLDRAEQVAFSRERASGYRRALADFGLAADPSLVVPVGTRIEDGRDAAHALLARANPPTAIFAYADLLAVGALRAAYERGIAVPRRLSVIGFDDIAMAAFLRPALTTIAAPNGERGERGAELLLAPGAPRGPIAVRLPVSLVVRETTGPASEP